MDRENGLPPRGNPKSTPSASTDDPELILVLYVHNRPQYLNTTLQALAAVKGIGDALLIVSHDGVYPEMESLVQRITFCRVKQIHSPFSPHLFHGSFPGLTPGDCQGNTSTSGEWPQCNGLPDMYKNHREPRIVSLKHHWWWMMNTVWDGLLETRGYEGHILFIEEDHFLLPNAILQAKALIRAKQSRFLHDVSFAALAPFDTESRGSPGVDEFVKEKLTNVGYIFNRTVWRKIHQGTESFCTFDDYNWDRTLEWSVLRTWDVQWMLRWSLASAQHVGKCGLHARAAKGGCEQLDTPPVFPEDRVNNVNMTASMSRFLWGREAAHLGWGGWGDERDRALCRHFSTLYLQETSHSLRLTKAVPPLEAGPANH